MSEPPERCCFCGHPLDVVWVHGHGQCRVCHTNIAPCCDGATNDDPADHPNDNDDAE